MNDFARHVAQDRELLARDLRMLADDAEALLHHAVSDADAGYGEAKERLRQRLAATRVQLGAWEKSVRQGASRAAATAAGYASENPWKAAGAAFTVGVAVALLWQARRR